MHTATLRAVGGSVPGTLLRQMRTLGLAAGASVTEEDGRLVLSSARRRYRLAGLLAGRKPGDMVTAPGSVDALLARRDAW